jgi:hypothetical protein
MREPLRANLQKAAKANKVSLNNELVARLERTFNEEHALGGPELRHIVQLMATAFLMGDRLALPTTSSRRTGLKIRRPTSLQ